MRSPTLLNASISTKSSGRRNNTRKEPDGISYSGYAPGIEKLDEWPIREESREYRERDERREYGHRVGPKNDYVIPPQKGGYTIKDFDEYSFGDRI